MNGKTRFWLIVLLAGALVLALEAWRERSALLTTESQLDCNLANFSVRVRAGDAKTKAATAAADGASLGKARAFALLLKTDAALLGDREKLDRFRGALDVDDICVTDGDGVIVASTTPSTLGYDFKSAAQSAAFMPAVTNAAFELAQAPQPRGATGELFQYVGVARLDAPGVVQVGIGAKRLDALRDMAGFDDIVRTSQVQHGGFVTIEDVQGHAGEAPISGVRSQVRGGRRVLVKSERCGAHWLSVGLPEPCAPLAGLFPCALLSVLSAVLFLALLRGLVRDERFAARSRWRACALFAAAAVASLLSFESCRERNTGASICGQLMLTLENTATQLRAANENVAAARRLADAAHLAKARALSLWLEMAPAVVRDQRALETICRTMCVDEVSVSDGRGVLVASVPQEHAGYGLASSPQSAEFLPAVTNRAFELVQKAQQRGLDGELFQYAGVARRDAPGVVSVGIGRKRLQAWQELVSTRAAVKAYEGEGSGLVEIVSGRSARFSTGFHVQERANRKYLCLSRRSDGKRITVGEPLPFRAFADERVGSVLALLAVLLFLGALAVLHPGVLKAASAHVRAWGAFFWGLRASASVSNRHLSPANRLAAAFGSPVVLVCLLAFLCAAGTMWMMQSSDVKAKAREQVEAQVEEAVAAVGRAVDEMLFAVGKSIVLQYRRPAALLQREGKELLMRQGLDEISVIDARGHAVFSTTGDPDFDMASSPESAKFNCLLHGELTYAQPFRESVGCLVPAVRKYAGVAFPDAPGYLQLGYDELRLLRDLPYVLSNVVEQRHFGRGGYMMVVSDTGAIGASGASAAKPDDTLAGIGVNVVATPGARKAFEGSFYGETCVAAWAPYGRFKIFAVLPASAAHGGGMLGTLAILLVTFAVFAFFASRLTGIVMQLQAFIAAEKDRTEKDMSMATTIQKSSLPVAFPDNGHFRIFALMDPAREVGGDFYDFTSFPDGRELFLIADVSGKGVPGALFMMKAKTTIRAAVAEAPDLASAVALANERLAAENEAEMFVTAWIGVLHPATGRVEFVNAGHNAPLVKRADGSVQWVQGPVSLVLAALPGAPYPVQELVLRKGDSLLLYTDGVTEATNPEKAFYGDERLEAVLAKAGPSFVSEIRADVDAFAAGAEQADDITMLALDYRG